MARRKNMETGEQESPRGAKPTPGSSKKPAGSDPGKKVGRAAEREVAARNRKPKVGKRDGSRVKAAAERGSQKADNSFKARLKASRDKAKPSRGRQVKEAEERVSKANPSKRTPDGGDYAAARRVRVARGENSSKEIGGKNYGHTGRRNSETAPLDDYITMMAAETGDRYVKGAGKAGAATSKKSTGKTPAKPQSKQGSRGASQSSSQPSGSRGGGGSRNYGGGNQGSVQQGRAPSPGQVAPGGRAPAATNQPPINRQTPPQYQQQGPPTPYQQNIGPMNLNPLQGMQAAQGMMQGMGSGQQGYRPPPGAYIGPGAGMMSEQQRRFNSVPPVNMQLSPNAQSMLRQHRGW